MKWYQWTWFIRHLTNNEITAPLFTCEHSLSFPSLLLLSWTVVVLVKDSARCPCSPESRLKNELIEEFKWLVGFDWIDTATEPPTAVTPVSDVVLDPVTESITGNDGAKAELSLSLRPMLSGAKGGIPLSPPISDVASALLAPAEMGSAYSRAMSLDSPFESAWSQMLIQQYLLILWITFHRCRIKFGNVLTRFVLGRLSNSFGTKRQLKP